MEWVFVVWGLLFFTFFGIPLVYNVYMRRRSTQSWDLKIDETYQPNISVLVPAHNEERIIRLKLENLYKIDYPPEKTEIIFVNDASTDQTLSQVEDFVKSNPDRKTRVLNRTERSGKSNALNFALKHAEKDVIVVSDADCFLAADALRKALPYLSDPTVGAVAGREMSLNPESSWVTRSEQFFNDFIQPQRLGESKVYSTLFFQGGLAAYKRACLVEFDDHNDDAGTALNIVQGNKRTIIVPEARFFTMSAVSWKNKVALKLRRTTQVQLVWTKILKMLCQNKLVLPKKIAIPEIFLQIVNPIILCALILTTFFASIEQPVFGIGLLLIFLLMLLMPKSRIALVESVQSYLMLLIALVSVVIRKQFTIWKTSDESRFLINEKVLRERLLI